MARVLISMPEEFLDRIDQVAEGENRTRSELIREALRSYMYKSRVKASTMATKNAAILEALLDWFKNNSFRRDFRSREKEMNEYNAHLSDKNGRPLECLLWLKRKIGKI